MEIVGWRAFKEGSAGGLTGVAYHHEWQPGPNKAECMALRFAMRNCDYCDPVPGEDCATRLYGAPGCGLYAYTEPQSASSYYLAPIVGLVAAWGRVIEHERGFRAQFMQIVALGYRNTDVFRPLSEYGAMYGVPVVPPKTLCDEGFASEFGEVL